MGRVHRAMTMLRRLRFVLWTTRLRLLIRRRGGKLVLDAPWGARLKGAPRLAVAARGEGDAIFHLRIGRNVAIGRDMSLRVDARGSNRLDLGDGVVLQDGVRIWLFSGRLTIGKNTILRDQVALKTGGELTIGEVVRIGYSTIVHCHERVDLAERVVLADQITLVDSDHVHDGSDTWFMKQPVRATPIRIDRNTLVGANSVITRGARLGRNAVVAAGAVVRAGEYPDAWLVGGVPAQPIRALSDDSAEQ
jgi:acetyltransferase-like isoleucine patch superfamily enzyme